MRGKGRWKERKRKKGVDKFLREVQGSKTRRAPLVILLE